MQIGNPVRTYTVTPAQVPQPFRSPAPPVDVPEKTEVEETRVTEKEKEAA